MRREGSARHPCRPPFSLAGRVLPLNHFTLVTAYRLASSPSTAKLRFDGNTRARRRPADRRRQAWPSTCSTRRTGRPAERRRTTPSATTPTWSPGVCTSGSLGPEEAERLIGGHAGTRTAARAVFARVLETRGYLYELFGRSRPAGTRRPPPSPGCRRDEAEALAHGELVRIDGRLRVALDRRRPRAAAVAGHPRGADGS